jgi:hypothetical protein
MAAATVVGVVTQLIIAARTDFGLVHFRYFTILSNLLASGIFIVSAIRVLRKTHSSARREAVRGASVVCMAFVGVVFNTLLVDVDFGGLLPWVNAVHHMLLPLAVVVDWLPFPPGVRLSLRTALLWVVAPVLYTLYSVARGAIVGFYPYPFLIRLPSALTGEWQSTVSRSWRHSSALRY